MHRLAGAFALSFVGKAVEASSPQGRFADGAALLDGRVLRAAEAHGKQMFLRFSDELWLRVHLGLYGMWRFAGPGLAGYGRRASRAAGSEVPAFPPEPAFPPKPRGLVRLRLLTRTNVADLSGPTACMLMSPAEKAVAMQRLGEDPLRQDADPAKAFAKIHASRSAIGLLLMRQDIVAGIGNIYRAEILFRARIDPHRPGREIPAAAWDALWTDLAALLRDGVQTGRIVTTAPADRARASGKVRGRDAGYVAHRAGQPCRVCRTPILAEPMAGRTLYWCPTCQTG